MLLPTFSKQNARRVIRTANATHTEQRTVAAHVACAGERLKGEGDRPLVHHVPGGSFMPSTLDLANAEAHKHPEGGTVEETQQHLALVYRAPTPEQVEKINAVRAALSAAIYAIQSVVPGCAEQTLAIRKLEECSFYANKAIVFDGVRYL